MVKKLLILGGIFVLLMLVWIFSGFLASETFGTAGFGGSLIIGFVIVPVVLRFAVIKLFKAGSRRLDQ